MFAFIEELPETFQTAEGYKDYCRFLLEFLVYKPENLHWTCFIRKMLSTIETLITIRGLPLSQLKEFVPLLYAKFAALIGLRFQGDTCRALLAESKDSSPLWYDVGQYFVRLSTFFICPTLSSPQESQPGMKAAAPAPATSKGKSKSVEQLNETTKSKEHLADEELQALAWTHTMKLIKEILGVSESALRGLDKSLAEEVVKKSQELDISMVHFILQVLLPSSAHTTKERQQELVGLIDNGCTAIYSSFTQSSASLSRSKGDSLSKFCTSTLLGLCANEQTEAEFADIKKKIATITTPVLINRCKNLLNKYLQDEKRSGHVPLPKYSIQSSV